MDFSTSQIEAIDLLQSIVRSEVKVIFPCGTAELRWLATKGPDEHDLLVKLSEVDEVESSTTFRIIRNHFLSSNCFYIIFHFGLKLFKKIQ